MNIEAAKHDSAWASISPDGELLWCTLHRAWKYSGLCSLSAYLFQSACGPIDATVHLITDLAW